MYGLMVLLLLISLAGSATVLHESTRAPDPPQEGSATALADNFSLYVGVVARYVAAQPPPYTAPYTANMVPDAELVFPSWYRRNLLWMNKVIDGQITVYPYQRLETTDFSNELTVRSDGAYGAGYVAPNLEIVSVRHGRTGIFVPAGVPVGVPVIQFVSSR